MHERCFNAGEIYNIFFMLFSKKCWKTTKKMRKWWMIRWFLQWDIKDMRPLARLPFHRPHLPTCCLALPRKYLTCLFPHLLPACLTCPPVGESRGRSALSCSPPILPLCLLPHLPNLQAPVPKWPSAQVSRLSSDQVRPIAQQVIMRSIAETLKRVDPWLNT